VTQRTSRPHLPLPGAAVLASSAHPIGFSLRQEAHAGGVRGRVLIGPTYPVVRAGPSCPEQPHPAQVDIIGASGRGVARHDANEQGQFAMTLHEKPSSWVATAPDETPIPWAQPLAIVVDSGEWTEVTVLMASVIR
jgi:hypothetical protein